MDIGRVLSRSLEIAWRYKVLWLFGFIMALTGGGTGNGLNYNYGSSNFNNQTAPAVGPLTSPQFQATFVIAILGFVACVVIVSLVLTLYFRFVARGSLVSFVRDVERGTTRKLGSAWREGHRYYWRLLGLGFLFLVPAMLVSIVVLLVAILPLIPTILAIVNSANRSQSAPSDVGPIIAGALGFAALLCCAIVFILILNLVVHPVYEFAVRAIVIEESRTMEGLARGYRKLRANIGSVSLLYLILILARIGWSVILAVLAFPIGLLLVAIIAVAVSLHSAVLTVLLALAVGLPFAIVLAFLEGLFQVFESNAWTEAYLTLLPAPSAMPSSDAPSTIAVAL
jgi:hypothetical protein